MADIPFTVDLDSPAAKDEAGKSPEKPARTDGSAQKRVPGAVGGRDPLPAEDSGERIWTVGQLTRRVRNVLEETLPAVAVEGEISNFKAAASGHLYFNLKDSDAQIRCVMFRAAAQSLRFTVEDGLQAIARGRLTVYEQRGEYQIQVALLEPKGVGALQVAFEQLKRKLESEGLFAPEAKQELPYLPRRIGIVTSPTGAAVRDMLHVLERRFPGMAVLIHPAAVQGERAAGEIAAGIATLNRLAPRQKIDLIIVGRGGGSVEDLWAFNEEAVARAIFASRVPIISAVGHEVDFTIADFVADVRAPTPSAAAEIAVPNRADLVATVLSWRERLLGRIAAGVERRSEQWRGLRARLGSPEAGIRQNLLRADDLRERLGVVLDTHRERAHRRHAAARELLLGYRPDRMIPLWRREARGLERRLAPALRRHVGRQRERAAGAMELLDSLSPLTVLRRGYGVVQDAAGNLVRSVRQVQVGDDVKVRLSDGQIAAAVQDIERDRD